MKKKVLSVLLSAGLLMTACSSGDGKSGQADKGENFAVVNGIEIKQETYDSQLDMFTKMLAAQYDLATSMENSLIMEAVMMSELEKNGVELTDADYQEDIDRVIKQRGGQEEYEKFLKDNGISEEQMKTSIRYETIHRKHKEWYTEKNAPSDEDMKAYFEANKDSLITVEASHILVETEEQAKEVLDRIDKGESFEDLAKELSIDTHSGMNGGALGESSPNAYVPEFSAALMEMKEGELSQPVKSQFGYHIIRLDKMNNSFDSVKEKIAESMTKEAYATYVQQQVDAAEVEKAVEDAEVEVKEVDSETLKESTESGESSSN